MERVDLDSDEEFVDVTSIVKGLREDLRDVTAYARNLEACISELKAALEPFAHLQRGVTISVRHDLRSQDIERAARVLRKGAQHGE